MDFEWDEDKRQANIRKHRIDFVDVPAVFDGYTMIMEDTRFNYEELHTSPLGFSKDVWSP